MRQLNPRLCLLLPTSENGHLPYLELYFRIHFTSSSSWAYAGWPLTWKTWKSQGIPKWLGRSQGKWKKSGKSSGNIYLLGL